MKQEWIESAKETTFKRFPEFRGVEPTVRTKKYKVSDQLLNKLGMAGKEKVKEETVLTFKKDAQAEDGTTLKRVLKVHIDSRGKITKFSGTK